MLLTRGGRRWDLLQCCLHATFGERRQRLLFITFNSIFDPIQQRLLIISPLPSFRLFSIYTPSPLSGTALSTPHRATHNHLQRLHTLPNLLLHNPLQKLPPRHPRGKRLDDQFIQCLDLLRDIASLAIAVFTDPMLDGGLSSSGEGYQASEAISSSISTADPPRLSLYGRYPHNRTPHIYTPPNNLT